MVDELEAEVLAWGERPDAFFALPFSSAVGWVGAVAATPAPAGVNR